MTWRILRPLAAAAAIAAIFIVVLAPHHGSAVDPVAEAADTTAASGSVEFGMAGSVSIDGNTIPIKGNGVMDTPHQRMRMSMSMAMPVVGDLKMDEIFDGSAIYIHMPEQLAQRVPGGKSWIKLDLAAFAKARGIDLKQLAPGNQSNPADMLKMLKAAGNSHVVGQEDINGDTTTHYAGSIDLTAIADRVGDKQSVASLKQLYAQAGISSIPVDVWVDRSGRVRQEAIKFSAGNMSMDMTIDYIRFGVPVDTTPPPADQTMDTGALLAGGSQS
jgi:hypothetical protein